MANKMHSISFDFKALIEKVKDGRIKLENAKNGRSYLNLTLSDNDTMNQFKQNIAAFGSQTREERENGVKKEYVANGKTFWSDDPSQMPKEAAPVNQPIPNVPINEKMTDMEFLDDLGL